MRNGERAKGGSAAVGRWLSPDFLGIGAMRSGTTWLVRRLRDHPEIWMSRRKEVHFFDRRLDSSRLWGLSPLARLGYAAFFVEGRFRGRRVTGEFTPSYALLPDERIRLIRSWMPDVRLIYCMRDPVERAWSHVRKDMSEGRLDPQAGTAAVLEFLDRPGVRARGDYAGCIRRWEQHFPRDRFHFLFLEDIARDPVGTLADVHDFLGVSAWSPADPAVVARPENSRLDSGMPDAIRAHLDAQFRDQAAELSAVVNRTVPWG